MPKVTLRLTEEEHRALTVSSHVNRRSLQREIVHRLFDGPLGRVADAVAEPIEVKTGDGRVLAQARSCAAFAPAGTKCKVCGKVHK